jgi:hypothetical protein
MCDEMCEQWGFLREFFQRPVKGKVCGISIDRTAKKGSFEVDNKPYLAEDLSAEGYAYCFKTIEDLLDVAKLLNDMANQQRKHDRECCGKDVEA